MKRTGFIFSGILCILLLAKASAQRIVPLQYRENKSFSYEELINLYKKLDQMHQDAMLTEWGMTDAGVPLHVFVINTDEKFTPEEIREGSKGVLMVMNGIHPGEPDGMDASVIWVDELLNDPDLARKLENVVLCIIPAYNIDGMLNRGCCTRANQNGPEEYGFRGNAQNLDLNRDFMKQESSNAVSFAEIFRAFDPDFFIDTHVSNGADYQHVFTLLHSSGDRLPEPLNTYHRKEIVPELYQKMEKKGYPVVPYVNIWNDSPDKGYPAFYDSPRYSNGYTSLWGTFSFTPETHMLKAFPERVEATRAFLEVSREFLNANSRKVLVYRNMFRAWVKDATWIPLRYEIDKSEDRRITFMGYEAYRAQSPITGEMQLYYDRTKPYEKKISYYDKFTTTYTAVKPRTFVIPFAYRKLAEKLEKAGVVTQKLRNDTLLQAETWYLPDVKFQSLYEGRPLFSLKDTAVLRVKEAVPVKAGSVLVHTGTFNDLYLMNALHPYGPDSYLVWGYFAAIAEQKEHFSSYIFDSYARRMLDTDAGLKAEFDAKRSADASFSANAYAQLEYLYKRSPFAEKTLGRYPIMMIF